MIVPQFMWKFVYRIHPFVREFVLFTGLLKHSGRQPYLIGRLRNSTSLVDVKRYLNLHGYEHNHLAWVDEDEVLSMRKRIGPLHQYHIRIHVDGEIRAHYEYAPEARPYLHMVHDVIADTEYFRRLLDQFLTSVGSPILEPHHVN